MPAMVPEVRLVNLASIRRGLGITQQDLAKNAEVTRQTIAKAEAALPVREVTAYAIFNAIKCLLRSDVLSAEFSKMDGTVHDYEIKLLPRVERKFDGVFADIDRLSKDVAYLELQIEMSENKQAIAAFVDTFKPVFRRFENLRHAIENKDFYINDAVVV